MSALRSPSLTDYLNDMTRVIASKMVIFSAAIFGLALAGCGSKHENAMENSSNLPVAQVRVQSVENKPRAMTEEVAGTVRAKLRATLEAKLSGRIEKLAVAPGDIVQKGQLIARLDAGENAARLEQAEASLEEAERNWNRASALLEQHSVTRAEYDSAQSRRRVAAGAVAEAKAMLGYAEMVAPFDGVVTRKWADAGDFAAPGKPLVAIEDPSALQVEADVPEASASRIHRDSRLGIRSWIWRKRRD